MCGIIYAKNLKDDKPVNEIVKALYINQKSRGKEGFGFIGMTKNDIDLYKAEDESDIINYLNTISYDEIFFHHRFPTSTANTIDAAHPFECIREDKKYYFIHNGVINNDEDLYWKHKDLGIKYTSRIINKDKTFYFNDSEALAWDFVLWLEGKNKKPQAIGTVAFLCLEVDFKTNRAEKLYFYANDGSPLKKYKDENIFLLSSETGKQIKRDRLFVYDYETKTIIKDERKFKIKCYEWTDWRDYKVSDYAGDNWAGFDTKRDEPKYFDAFEIEEKEKKLDALYKDYEKATLTNDNKAIIMLEDKIADCELRLAEMQDFSDYN